MNNVKVVFRYMDYDGNFIGKYDSSHMLNTMEYDVEFPDGCIHKYEANVITDNVYSQVNSEGFSHSILSVILDFSKDTTTVQKGDQYIITKSGQRRMQKSTVGWNLLISWKYGSEQWIPLLVMK